MALEKLNRAAALLFGVLVAACGQAKEDVGAPIVRPVKFVTVQNDSRQFTASFPAVFQAAQSTELTFQVGGLLQELPVIEGQAVAQGGLIARLDQRDYRNRYNSAKAQYDNAESEYQRARRLAAENAISQSVLEQRLSQRDIAKAQFDTAKKALDDTTLTAPYAGLVAEVLVEQYQNVSPQQPIVVFQSDGDVEAVVNVPARLIAVIPQVQPINPTVTIDVAPELKIPAQFKESTVQADPTTQTYRASFTFEAPDELLILPGMTGSVTATFLFTGDEYENGVAAPLSAILYEAGQTYVWLIDKETMTVSRQPVDVADQRIGETVTIIAGLAPGDTIAGAGASYLQDGMTVREWKQDN